MSRAGDRASLAAASQVAAPGAAQRLFFALWPDEEQRAALARAAHKAVRHCGGRPVPVENLHVTLAFLGAVPRERVAELAGVARRVAAAFAAPPPMLSFDRLAHWPRPQLLCALGSEPAGVPVAPAQPDEPPGAAFLATALKDETAAAGFTPDLKLFRVHVTVARKVVHAPAAQALASVEWRFAAFVLIESRTASSGPIYSAIDSYSLVNAQKAR